MCMRNFEWNKRKDWLNVDLILSVETRSKSWGSNTQNFILGYFCLEKFSMKSPRKDESLKSLSCHHLSVKNLPHSNQLVHPGRRVLLVQAGSGLD